MKKSNRITHAKVRKILRNTFLIISLSLILAIGISFIIPPRPYAISMNNKDVCYVADRETGINVLKEVIDMNCPSEITPDEMFNVENIRLNKASRKSEVIEQSKAAEIVNDNLSECAIVFSGTGTETSKIKPKTEYIQDDTLFAGESEIIQEGKAGKKSSLISYKFKNDEIIDTTVLSTTVTKEPVNKIIKKGTLGLPEGEDWKTYDGPPLYENGDDIVKAALTHLGAPYKYGGKSFETGIDCVQFIRQVYAKYGVKLPNGKYGLQHAGSAVSYDKAQPGDIICYTNHHYAIYLGDGKIVHATSKGGVKTGKAKYKKIVTIRRIHN